MGLSTPSPLKLQVDVRVTRLILRACEAPVAVAARGSARGEEGRCYELGEGVIKSTLTVVAVLVVLAIEKQSLAPCRGIQQHSWQWWDWTARLMKMFFSLL